MWFVANALLSTILWMLRVNPFQAGWLFSRYLLFDGVERVAIETIRVHPEYALLEFAPTHAEGIYVLLIAAGGAGLVLTWQRMPGRP